MVDSNSILPQFFPTSWCEEDGVFGVDFADGVALGFVNRIEGGYAFLSTNEIEALKTSIPDLLLQAQSNLSKLEGATLTFAHPEGTTVAWIEADDNFSSVRILQPDILPTLIAKLGIPFLITIPSRDVCLCWSVNAPRSLHAKHAVEAAQDFGTEEYNLSPQVFSFTGQWPCLPYLQAT